MADLNISISDLRTRITLQEPTLSKDSSGAKQKAYSTIATNPTIWVQWINDHGQEAVSSDVLTSVQRATVRGRHRNDIVESWCLLKNNERWKILSIDLVQGRNRWFELRVERVKGTA